MILLYFRSCLSDKLCIAVAVFMMPDGQKAEFLFCWANWSVGFCMN